jgi:hypothetical protein
MCYGWRGELGNTGTEMPTVTTSQFKTKPHRKSKQEAIVRNKGDLPLGGFLTV